MQHAASGRVLARGQVEAHAPVELGTQGSAGPRRAAAATATAASALRGATATARARRGRLRPPRAGAAAALSWVAAAVASARAATAAGECQPSTSSLFIWSTVSSRSRSAVRSFFSSLAIFLIYFDASAGFEDRDAASNSSALAARAAACFCSVFALGRAALGGLRGGVSLRVFAFQSMLRFAQLVELVATAAHRRRLNAGTIQWPRRPAQHVRGAERRRVDRLGALAFQTCDLVLQGSQRREDGAARRRFPRRPAKLRRRSCGRR